jgi:hypothetical protein
MVKVLAWYRLCLSDLTPPLSLLSSDGVPSSSVCSPTISTRGSFPVTRGDSSWRPSFVASFINAPLKSSKVSCTLCCWLSALGVNAFSQLLVYFLFRLKLTIDVHESLCLAVNCCLFLWTPSAWGERDNFASKCLQPWSFSPSPSSSWLCHVALHNLLSVLEPIALCENLTSLWENFNSAYEMWHGCGTYDLLPHLVMWHFQSSGSQTKSLSLKPSTMFAMITTLPWCTKRL